MDRYLTPKTFSGKGQLKNAMVIYFVEALNCRNITSPYDMIDMISYPSQKHLQHHNQFRITHKNLPIHSSSIAESQHPKHPPSSNPTQPIPSPRTLRPRRKPLKLPSPPPPNPLPPLLQNIPIPNLPLRRSLGILRARFSSDSACCC